MGVGRTGASIQDRSEAYLKRAKAAELRRSGMTWEKVAAEAGYSDRSHAYRAVKDLLKEHQSLAYDEIATYRQESLDRLHDLLHAVWPRAMKGDDKAVAEARRIISQIDDLTGAKAPVRVEIGESDVDKALRELDAELGRRAAEAARQTAGGQDQDG